LHCNDHAHNASRGHDPNRIDYNGDRGRDRNDCHSVRLDNDYSANGRLDRSNSIRLPDGTAKEVKCHGFETAAERASNKRLPRTLRSQDKFMH
jgi:hypothetical protein